MTDRDTMHLLVAVGQSDSTLEFVLREVQDRDPRSQVTVTLLVDPATRQSGSIARLEHEDDVLVTVATEKPTGTRIGELAAEHRATRVLVDETLGVDLTRLRRTIDAPVDEIPVSWSSQRRALTHRRGVRRFVGTFLLSYAFYLFLGDPLDPFDLVTGAVSAGVVAVVVGSVVFETEPTLGRTTARLLRATVFLPYLLYEVVRANLSIARVILDPALPIDPRMVEHDPRTDDRFHRAVLANAITLTPGSLTVDIDEEGFLVHTLTPSSRRGLEAGSLQRAVDFVFYGWDR